MKRKLYQLIASAFVAYNNCLAHEVKTGNKHEWTDRHEDRIIELCQQYMPSGSGFDAGTRFDFDRSRADLLIFKTAFHHMDENGMYDGWSDPITVKIRPTFEGIDITITGIRRKNRELDSDYFYDTFYEALCREMEERT